MLTLTTGLASFFYSLSKMSMQFFKRTPVVLGVESCETFLISAYYGGGL